MRKVRMFVQARNRLIILKITNEVLPSISWYESFKMWRSHIFWKKLKLDVATIRVNVKKMEMRIKNCVWHDLQYTVLNWIPEPMPKSMLWLELQQKIIQLKFGIQEIVPNGCYHFPNASTNQLQLCSSTVAGFAYEFTIIKQWQHLTN